MSPVFAAGVATSLSMAGRVSFDPLRDLDRLLALPVTLIPIVAADNGHGEAVIQSIARSHSRSCVGRPASFSSG